MSHYVVTGGAGFIGSAIVRSLLREGARKVVVIDNMLTGYERNLEEVRGAIDFQRADIRNYEEIAPLIRGASVVFHEAAIPSVPRSIDDPVPSHEVNVNGTFNVLRAAHEGQAGRVIYAASSSAYGDTDVLPKVETMNPQPKSPYALQKLVGEYYCNIFTSGVQRRNRGPALLQRLRAAAGPLERLFRRAFDFHEMRHPGLPAHHLRRWRTIARLHLRGRRSGVEPQSRPGARTSPAACTTPATAAGSRSTRPGRSCRRSPASAFPAAYGPPRSGDVRDSQADTTAAVRDLGHAPRFSFEDGMRRTFEWYRQTAEPIALLLLRRRLLQFIRRDVGRIESNVRFGAELPVRHVAHLVPRPHTALVRAHARMQRQQVLLP